MTEQPTSFDPRTRELTILNAIAQALNRSASLDAALHATLVQTVDLLNLQAGWIWLRNEATGEHYLAAAQGLPPALATDPHKMEGLCRCVEASLQGDLAGGKTIDVITCPRLKDLVAGTDGLCCHASIPLHAYDRRIGILNVASPGWCELSAEDLNLLYTIGDMLGLAVERARLHVGQEELGVVRERTRLAREIHATLAQGLSAIALQLETADVLLDRALLALTLAAGDAEIDHGFAGARRAVQQALALTRTNVDEARRAVLDLRAAPLEDRSLPAALAALAADTTAQAVGKTVVTLVTVGGSRPLPASIEVGLYRVAQEAVANSLRHAGARRIELTLTITPVLARLAIDDDGRGFVPDTAPPARYGITGMNECIALLGGALHIRSTPGAGTHIEASIPLEGSALWYNQPHDEHT